MDFFNQTGKLALGSRLRMLSDQITSDAEELYSLYDVGLKPKWFPVFFVLSNKKELSITEIAEEIGHSHPSVCTIIREMSKAGVVREKKSEADRRVNVISLSEEGKKIVEKIEPQYTDVNNALDELLERTNHNIWKAMEELEYLLSERSLLKRVVEEKKKRESKAIQIVPYQAQYKSVFRDLNVEWIRKYFKMEEADYKALDNPEESVIQKGGFIFVALFEDEPLGVCALAKIDDPDYEYELAKMAVSPKAQGKGIGFLLGQAIIEKARSLGTAKLYLESNTVLKPAIRLYEKLGFKKVGGRPSPYERCNIQMELVL